MRERVNVINIRAETRLHNDDLSDTRDHFHAKTTDLDLAFSPASPGKFLPSQLRIIAD